MANHEWAEDENLDRCMQRLQHAVQALALPAAAQVLLFPDWVVPADELALNLDHWWRCIQPQAAALLSASQRATLNLLLRQVAAPRSADPAALAQDPQWAAIRDLAQEVLAACGWPAAPPPSYADEYVRGGAAVPR
jgi:hypothetical protein